MALCRYVLTTVGAERIYVCMEPPSTTHAGDCMFIAPQVVEGTLWHVVYEWRAVPNKEASKNWSSVLQSFELWRPFGCISEKKSLNKL